MKVKTYVNDVDFKFISTMFFLKLVTSIKVIISCLGIPIVKKNTLLKYINPKLPSFTQGTYHMPRV